MAVTEYRGAVRGAGRRFAVVVSRFNDAVTKRLLSGALACFEDHGVEAGDVDVIWVPGAWELPWAARTAVDRGGYAGVVALGCVIRGETRHFEFVAGPAADGLARLALESRIPIALGLLTTETLEQALDRAGGRHGNKGWDAAEAAIELADLAGQLGGEGAGA